MIKPSNVAIINDLLVNSGLPKTRIHRYCFDNTYINIYYDGSNLGDGEICFAGPSLISK